MKIVRVTLFAVCVFKNPASRRSEHFSDRRFTVYSKVVSVSSILQTRLNRSRPILNLAFLIDQAKCVQATSGSYHLFYDSGKFVSRITHNGRNRRMSPVSQKPDHVERN